MEAISSFNVDGEPSEIDESASDVDERPPALKRSSHLSAPPPGERFPSDGGFQSNLDALAKATRSLADGGEEPSSSREHLLAQQLALEQRQFERLKHDFTYNLSLLRERDAELERYDVESAAMRAELEQRTTAASLARSEVGERDAQLADERRKQMKLREAVQASEKRIRELSDTAERREAEAKRWAAEVETARKQRADALAAASKAKVAADEQRQDATSVRTEVQLRLQQQQQQQAEEEANQKAQLAEERAQHAAQVKAVRAEARREASALQEQLDKLQVRAA